MPRNAVVLAALALVSLATPALAGDLDGTWQRDDKKVYVIAGDEGMEDSPRGEYASRFTIARAEGRLEWRHRFTRTEDERGYFETTTRSSGAVEAGATKLELDFEWVDLDDKGKVTARGTERHTLERTAPLADKDRARVAATLAHHRKIDSFLGPDARLDRALAEAEAALKDPLVGPSPALEARRKALARSAAAKPAAAPASAAPAGEAAKGKLLDLTSAGFAVTIRAPEGATAKGESWGECKVTLGEDDAHFGIAINTGPARIANHKKDITSNDVNKLKAFLTETDDTLVYESEVMGEREFHFVTNVKLGELELAVEDIKGPAHSKDDVLAMVAAVRTLALAKGGATGR